jgi:crotonobetainyl-CoA:carnitine CoA-transferase CaiB-like acyl-CoA transferase
VVGGALDQLRVIDFGQYLAGPLAAMVLADAGAEVIRVDPPGGPRWNHPAHAILQHGKRSDTELGPVLMAGPSGRLSRTPPRPMSPPRPPGADNAELQAELGLADRYPTLLAQGIIASSVRSTTARPTPVPTRGVVGHDR